MAPAETLNFYVSILLIWCPRFCSCVLYKISLMVNSNNSPFFSLEKCRRVWWTMPLPCSTSQTYSGWKRGKSTLISTLRVSMDSWQQGWEPVFFSLILFSDQCWNANFLFAKIHFRTNISSEFCKFNIFARNFSCAKIVFLHVLIGKIRLHNFLNTATPTFIQCTVTWTWNGHKRACQIFVGIQRQERGTSEPVVIKPFHPKKGAWEETEKVLSSCSINLRICPSY